jgi:hypothetical protein
VLGELDGWWSVGEMRRLYEALERGMACGCGKVMPDCEFWSAIRAQASAAAPALPEERVFEVQRNLIRTRPAALYRLWRQTPGPPESAPQIAYARLIEAIYTAVADQTGSRVIADGSKGPHCAYALTKFSDADIYLLHLVRDPRAVAYAWLRRFRTASSEKPEDRALSISQRPVYWSLSRWIVRNALIEALLKRRMGGRYMRMRYEDFCAAPAESVEQISSFLGEAPQSIPGLADGRIKLGVHHTAGGNPARMESGETLIKADMSWRNEMGTGLKAVASFATLPLTRRYGYPAFG